MPEWEPMVHELVGERRGRLIAFATLLAGRDHAEDVFHDALIATFSKKRRFTSSAQAEQYVRRAIATRHTSAVRKFAADDRRVRQVSGQHRVAGPEVTTAPEPALDAALMALTPRVRSCIVLRFLEDMSTRDTAAALDISEGAVKRYVSDGLAQLNAALGTSFSDAERPTVGVMAPKEGAR